jgi:DNA-binding SARP family transcriptional activator
VEYRILGPLEVEENGQARQLGGAKQRALLAVLLVHANEVVSADRLIESVWGEHRPATAAKTLQVHVSRLRKALGRAGRLESRAGGYVLELTAGELDLDRFRELVAEGVRALERNQPRAAGELLREALALWRGPPLADFVYDSFAQAEIGRLDELRLEAVERRIEADLALGRQRAVIGELEALVREHPLRERLCGHLMLALYRSGRQAEALEVYQAARSALVEELGIEPGRPLRELHQQILRQETALDLAVAAEPALDQSRGAFVGRGPELAELEGGLEGAFAGRGRLFLLAGEPGIGKSRLAEELARSARARGARVLVGRCWEAGGAPAYWPWLQSLRTYVRESDQATLRAQLGAGAADLAQIVPELRERFPDLPEPAATESEGARFRLFDATAEFVRNASGQRPIVVVLDDLHAADAPSLLLLRFLARELSSMHTLVVGAYRDVDPTLRDPLTEFLAEVSREPATRRLPLRGLDESDVEQYVELTASEIASPELAATLHQGTEGNPLFLGETVRLLSLEGVPSDSTAPVRLAIPQTVREVIARRLSHLSEPCRRTLLIASVLGREFALAALARMSDLADKELLDPLDEAIAARVVSDVTGSAPPRLRFAHIVIRDTLYDGIPAARRVRLHRQAVETLEALHGDDPGPHLAELAQHSLAGNDFDSGLLYARRAGDRALALVAYEEAARLYETALDALEASRPWDERTRCELLLSLGSAEARAGNTAAADTALLASADIARRLGLQRELARAAVEYGGRMVWIRASEVPGLVPLLEEALAALGSEDVALRARLLARLAGALRDEPSRERRDALSREAVDLARRTGNLAALVEALDGRSWAILAPDTAAECMGHADELREVAERIGSKERVVDGYMGGIGPRVAVGDIAGAEAALDAAAPLAEQIGQPAHLYDVCSVRAMLALARGKLDEGEELVEQALALGERAVPGAVPVHHLHRYTLSAFRGALPEDEQKIVDLAAAYPARPVLRCIVAHLNARRGRLSEANQAVAQLVEHDVADLPFDQEWPWGMSFLAETSALLGDSRSGYVLYRMLLPWAALTVVDMPEGIRGSVSRYLGLLAATGSRWDEAKRHFEDALAANERMGLRPWLALTQADYARMLTARAAPGDRQQADELLAAALATSRELGMRLGNP